MNRKGMKPWEQMPWVGTPIGWVFIQIILAVFCVGVGVKICMSMADGTPPPVAASYE